MKTKHSDLIICADDYGINSKVNEAIIDLLQKRKINATSVMVYGVGLHDLKIIKHNNCSIGLHFDLTELAHSSKYKNNLYKLIFDCMTNRLDTNCIAMELESQLRIFIDIFGFLPDHIDGHQHIHALPNIRHIIFKILRDHYDNGRCFVRNPSPSANVGRFFLKRMALNFLFIGYERNLKNFNFDFNDHFDGVYDFSESVDYPSLLMRWINRHKEQTIIMTHPSFLNKSDPLGTNRYKEYQALRSSSYIF
jgi:predicted glycoside hydrolase/deacetylase ChbG (UPF0249 family)